MPYAITKIDNFTGGLNTSDPVTIEDKDLVQAENVELTNQGRIKVRGGTKKRFDQDFDNNPVKGIAPFYKADGTTRLVIAAGSSLYVDNPHVTFDYDEQSDFKQEGVYTNLDTESSPGELKMYQVLEDGFEDGTFDWWVSHDAGWSIDHTEAVEGVRSAKGEGSNQTLSYSLGAISTTHLLVELAVRMAETDKVHYPIVLTSETDTTAMLLVAADDGHFKYWNGTSYTNFPIDKTYTAETWYQVELRVSNGMFWLFVDDVCLTPNGASIKDMSNNPFTKVVSIGIQNAAAEPATLWIDDVYINPRAAVFVRSSEVEQDVEVVAPHEPRFESARETLMDGFTTGTLQNAKVTDVGLEIDLADIPVFSRPSTAKLGDDTVVAKNEPRFETGKFGKALMIEQAGNNRAAEVLKLPTRLFNPQRGTVELRTESLATSPNRSVLLDLPDTVGDAGFRLGISRSGKVFVENKLAERPDFPVSVDYTETSRQEFGAGILEQVWAKDGGLQLDTTVVKTWNDFTGENWEVLA